MSRRKRRENSRVLTVKGQSPLLLDGSLLLLLGLVHAVRRLSPTLSRSTANLAYVRHLLNLSDARQLTKLRSTAMIRKRT